MKALKTFLIIAILSMILGACEKEPVKIGFSANLTGTGSELATAALYGVTMAKDEINKAGGIEGRHIELIIRDDNNDADSALQADLELAEEGAVVIIGHMVSSLGRLSVPHTNEVQMPMISPTMSSTVYADQDDYFFTLIPLSSAQAKRMVQAVEALGYSKPGVLYDRSNPFYTEAVVRQIEDSYQGTLAFVESFDAVEGGQGIDEMSERLMSEDYDCLLVVSAGYDVAKLLQYFYKQDVTVPMILSSWGMSNDLINGAGPAAEGVYAVNVFDEGSDNSSYLAFKELYMNTYGETPTFASMYGYEAMKVAAAAIEKAGKDDGQAIKEALDNLGIVTGLQGDFEFDSEGDVSRETVLFQVQEGRFVNIED